MIDYLKLLSHTNYKFAILPERRSFYKNALVPKGDSQKATVVNGLRRRFNMMDVNQIFSLELRRHQDSNKICTRYNNKV